ncbi:hypothetical protein BX600DRAFT_507461 [Xylariales sp. PMI_506]|nr:hypothetical protein BX600DRAFT_507461 [Xylariales sp. PMI_506]
MTEEEFASLLSASGVGNEDELPASSNALQNPGTLYPPYIDYGNDWFWGYAAADPFLHPPMFDALPAPAMGVDSPEHTEQQDTLVSIQTILKSIQTTLQDKVDALNAISSTLKNVESSLAGTEQNVDKLRGGLSAFSNAAFDLLNEINCSTSSNGKETSQSSSEGGQCSEESEESTEDEPSMFRDAIDWIQYWEEEPQKQLPPPPRPLRDLTESSHDVHTKQPHSRDSAQRENETLHSSIKRLSHQIYELEQDKRNREEKLELLRRQNSYREKQLDHQHNILRDLMNKVQLAFSEYREQLNEAQAMEEPQGREEHHAHDSIYIYKGATL